MKKALPYLAILGGTIGMFAALRPLVSPKLTITAVNNQSKSGRYSFGSNNIEQDFSLNKVTELSARNGWSVVAKSNDGRSITFDLYRNGKYIKHAKTIIFS